MATNDFDTGGVLSNLWNDIKHIPERTIQQSRALRADTRMDAIRRQADQDAIQKHLDTDATARWQAAHGDAPVPLTPDGKVNRAVINGALTNWADQHGVDQDVNRTYAVGEAQRNLALSNQAATDLGEDLDPRTLQRGVADAISGPKAANPTPAPGLVPAFVGAGTPPAPSGPVMSQNGTGQPPAALPAPSPTAPNPANYARPSPFAMISQRLRAAKAATHLGDFKAEREAAAGTEIAKTQEQAALKKVDDFGTAFGRSPAQGEVDENGHLTPAAENALHNAQAKISQGYRIKPGTTDWEAIPGSKPAQAELAAQEKKAAHDNELSAKAAGGMQAQTDMQANIKQAIANLDGGTNLPGGLNTRAGILGSHLTGVNQGGTNLKNSLDAVRSGQGIAWLNDMKNAANGSTGIGRIMKTEFDAAGSAQRNLHQDSDPVQLRQNLNDLSKRSNRMQRLYQEYMAGAREVPQWYKDELAQEAGFQPQAQRSAPNAPALSGGVKVLSIKRVQ